MTPGHGLQIDPQVPPPLTSIRAPADRAIPLSAIEPMFSGFTKIVEECIRKAQRNGQFDNLAGSGKPLPLEEDRHIAEDLRLSHKILKNADCLPPEIELKKEIERTEELLCGMEETAEKYRILKKLNFLIMKFNSTRNTSIQFELPQQYADRLAGRFESGNQKAKEV